MAVLSERSSRVPHRVRAAADLHDGVFAQSVGSLIEAAPCAIVCLSSDHRILEFNRAAERLHGRKRATVLGQDYVELFVSEDRQQNVAAEIQGVLDGRPASTFENSIRMPDGSVRGSLWSVGCIFDVSGEPESVIAVGQDISEHQRGEATLRRYENIVRTSGDLMAFVDTDYVYQAVNVSYVNSFGKTRDQIVGSKVADLFGQEVFRTHIKPNLDRCLAGESLRYQIWRSIPKLGNRCLDVQLSPFRDSDGSISGAVTSSRDITEQRQVEQSLVEKQRQLRALASNLALAEQRERRRVAVGLHDQVGQALAAAKLKLGLALKSALPADARRALEEAQALLTESVEATRTLTFQLGSTVLKELGLEAALQQLVERFDADNHDIHYVLTVDEQPKPLDEDPGLILYDITRELLFNAAKHARARTVSLRVERAGDRLRIIVEDDGVGFDTACLCRGPSVKGGFGYFSIRERLVHLGGELEVESSPGCGTRVVVAASLQQP